MPELICYNRPGRGQLCQRHTSAPRTADFFFFFLHIPSFTGQRVSLTVLSGNKRAEMLVEFEQAVFGQKRRFPRFVKQYFTFAYCFIIVCSVKNFSVPENQRCWLLAAQNSCDTPSTVPSNIFPFFFVVFGCIFFFPLNAPSLVSSCCFPHV